MAHYYFHMRSPNDYIRDFEGMDLADMDEVREEAFESAKEILSDAIRAGRDVDHQEYEVMDETGRIVLTYPLRDAIRMP